MAATAWGHQWPGRRIIAHCDNLAVVNIWGRNSSKSPTIMTLVRKLFFIVATHHFTSYSLFSHTGSHQCHRRRTLAQRHHKIQETGTRCRLPDVRATNHPLNTLQAEAHYWAKHSVASSTQRLYATARNQYNRFCKRLKLSPFPVSTRHCLPLLPFWHEIKQHQLSPPTWPQ